MLDIIFHTILGPSGVIKLIQVKKLVTEDKKRLKQITKRNKKIIQKIKLLEEENINLDLLDEESRKYLGYIGKNETFLNME